MKLQRLLAGGAVALVCCLGTSRVSAQPGPPPGFDPQQMRQRMMERLRENLDVKDDAEWKVIEGKIEKVMEARRELGPGGLGFFGGPRRPRGGDNSNAENPPRRFRGFEPNAEAEALQQAIESNASADEIKAKLEKYRQATKEREAKLEQAQDDLRKVLSVKQEAFAVLAGLLK